MFVPGVDPKPVPNLFLGVSADDQYGAAFFRQWPAEQDEAVVDKAVDELGMLIPKRLLAGAFTVIAVRSGGRCDDVR
jgi:hypothetical protein